MNRPARAFTIDYAVLAKADNAAMVPLEAGWSDIGSWSALWKIGARDADDIVRLDDQYGRA